MPGDRAQIQEIKSRLDIADIISRYVSLSPSGAGFKGKCPFHKDDTPSMTVSQEKGLWHCFGCGEGGDVIAFVMKIENLSFVEAMERLADEAGVSFQAKSDGRRDEDRALMAEVASYFASNLRSSAGEPARDYLRNRGYEEDVWETFGLGFALPGWDHVKKRFGQYGEEKLISLGLLVKGEKGIYDRFRNRTIFPILDASGRPVGFGGRAFEDQPKYLNSPQTPLFDKGRLVYGISWARDTMSKTRTAVLVEGYTDVITLHQAGIQNAVGSMGTALTQGQAELMKRFVEEVVIAYDQDSAGSAASIRGMQILRNTGLAVRVATLPIGEDPDGYVRSQGSEGMNEVLDRALPFHRFYIHSLVERHDVSTPRGQQQLFEEVRGFYQGIESAALREEIEKELEGLVDLSIETIRRELPRAAKAAPRLETSIDFSDAKPGNIEHHLLAVVLRGDASWEDVAGHLSPDVFSEENRAIAECLARGVTELSEMMDELDEEGARRASFYALAPMGIDVEKTKRDSKRWMGSLRSIEQVLAGIDHELKAAAEAEDWKRWDALMKKKEPLRVSWLRAKDAVRKGIHDNQKEASEEEGS